MRKIKSGEEIENKRKKNAIILSFFMLGILVLSTLGFAFLSGYGLNDGSVIPQNSEEIQQIGDAARPGLIGHLQHGRFAG